MEEKFCQLSEEENLTNYNYEDFVRIIKKDESNTSPKSYKLDEIDYSKENQKENLINSIQSSEVTSISFSQTENLSQTSDNLYIPNDTKQNNLSRNIIEGKNGEKEMDYFFGYENYFRRLYPEKFNEYKISGNFLPKKNRDIDKNISYENNIGTYINNESKKDINNNHEENKVDTNSNSFQIGNNFYYYPMDRNLLYYLYNNFYINYANMHPPSPGDSQKEISKIEYITAKKEEEIQKSNQDESEPKIDEQLDNKNNNEEEGEYEHIYIIKRKNVRNNYHNNNKKKFNKQEKQERPNEKRNHKDNNHYNYNNKNNYYYNNNNSYTKFNRNYDKRKKRFNYENNFYNKKYHKEIYY